MTNIKIPVVGLDQVADPDAFRIFALHAAYGLSPEDLDSNELKAFLEQDQPEQ